MKFKIYHLYLGFIVVFVACTNTNGLLPNSQLINTSDTCVADCRHSYEIYMPAAWKDCKAQTLVIIIDPQGQGRKAIEQFTQAADKYNLALVASNLIRNNDHNYLQSIKTLINDVSSKYPISDEVYLAGFSGGARMVLSYAQHHAVKGVFACGALAQANQIEAIDAHVMVIGGLTDFNFIEAAQYIFRPSRAPHNLYIEFTNQKHTWPGKAHINSALGYLILSSTSSNQCYKSELIKEYCMAEYERINKYQKSNSILLAGLMARNMSRNQQFNEYRDFISIRNSIEYSQPYIAELELLKNSIRLELELRKEYGEALTVHDIEWWQPELLSLKESIESSTDMYKTMALERVKSFLGIVCYSISSQSTQAKDLNNLERIIPIYQKLEPDNADMFYFKALSKLWEGEEKEAVKILNKSIELGFSDKQRMQIEIPNSTLRLLTY